MKFEKILIIINNNQSIIICSSHHHHRFFPFFFLIHYLIWSSFMEQILQFFFSFIKSTMIRWMNNFILYKDNVFFYQHNPFNTLIIIQSKKRRKNFSLWLLAYWFTNRHTPSISNIVIGYGYTFQSSFFFYLLMTTTTTK